MNVPVQEGSVSQTVVMTGIEQMVAEGRADRQLALVREHWTAVWRLWLDTPEPLRAARLGDALAPDFWWGAGLPGLATVTALGDRFEFTAGGKNALIIPAYHVIPGTLDADPAAHVEHLVDLVAVDLDRPDRFWRRLGKALVLGNAFLEIAGQEGAPVPVYRNPMTWLRSVGAGVIILDWAWARELLLDRELIAEDVALGERLEAVLAPSILVMEAT